MAGRVPYVRVRQIAPPLFAACPCPRVETAETISTIITLVSLAVSGLLLYLTLNSEPSDAPSAALRRLCWVSLHGPCSALYMFPLPASEAAV